MNPQIIHRYAWPIREAIEHLLDDVVGDCEAWQVRIEGEQLVIDVVEPGPVFDGGIDRSPEREAAYRARESSNEAAKNNATAPEEASLNKSPKPDTAPAEPLRKGGALARQAGIICGEKGFWTFVAKKFSVAVASADEAATWLKAQCGVASRIDFDYDEAKAANFREIDKTYRLWLEGYD
jgi:hypothetical protein